MELDDAYSNTKHVADSAGYPPRWAAAALAFRTAEVAAGRARLDLAYGGRERERFDLFLPEGEATGVVIFVHGGYWLRFDRSFWSHFAKGPLARGWAVALPSYDLCPAVRVSQITRQIARAVQAIADMVPGPVALTGHSAGGHLVARMLAPGMLEADLLARISMVVPISPVADLRPLMKTSMNADLQLTEAEAEAESPVFQPAPATPVVVRAGAAELPAFVEQAQALATAWRAGLDLPAGLHHFSVIEALRDPESELVTTLTGG